MTKEKTLSDKIEGYALGNGHDARKLRVEDVKEFIQKLKEKLIKEQKDFCQEANHDEYYFNEDVLKRKIDKLAGSELSGEELSK